MVLLRSASFDLWGAMEMHQKEGEERGVKADTVMLHDEEDVTAADAVHSTRCLGHVSLISPTCCQKYAFNDKQQISERLRSNFRTSSIIEQICQTTAFKLTV